MKKIAVYSFVLFFYSCSSPNRIIENYLLYEVKNDTIKKNILIKKRTSFEEAFTIFRGMKLTPRTDEELKIHQEIKNKFTNEVNTNWKKSDFKKINFDIINEDSVIHFLNSRREKFNNRIEADRFNMFFISKPYYYQKNKVFFRISKTRFFRKRIYDNVIILERKKMKWIIVKTMQNTSLY
ncbi:hypothetical protein [Flavobacterium sp.]|uniref:hypothetical protein n=1 Tax=Flavobacterium sp. TaxID=239 RepID=UPI003751029F